MAYVLIVSAAIFVAGVVVGVFVLTTVGIKREEKDFSQTGRTMTRRFPDRISRGARLVTGLYVRRQHDHRDSALAVEHRRRAA